MLVYLPTHSNVYTHVKWFSDNIDRVPLPFSRIITLTFLFWLAFTVLVLWFTSSIHEPMGRKRPLFVFTDGWTESSPIPS